MTDPTPSERSTASGGERLPFADWVLPVAVIAIGAVLLVRGLTRRPGHGAP